MNTLNVIIWIIILIWSVYLVSQYYEIDFDFKSISYILGPTFISYLISYGLYKDLYGELPSAMYELRRLILITGVTNLGVLSIFTIIFSIIFSSENRPSTIPRKKYSIQLHLLLD